MSTIIATYIKDPDAIKTYTIRWGAPNWAATTAYVVDDAVYDPLTSKYYLCTIAHTSQAARSSDSSRWSVIDEGLFLATGVTLSSDTWVVPTGITKDSETNDSYKSTITLSGGTAGKTYNVTCRGTFSDNDVDDRTLRIRVRDIS